MSQMEAEWIKQLGTASTEYSMSIATDSNNNVYITGYTYGALDGTNQGSGDAFVVKFDSDGTEVWRTQLGTSEEDQAYGIATDSDNNVYITGIT